MRILSAVPAEIVARHLKATGTAVDLPFKLSDYQAFRIALDADDVGKIVLWWQNEDATKDLNCRLIDSDHRAGNPVRVSSFIHGDAIRGFEPADLRTLPNKEPVVVTDNLHGDFFYLIDGSHRTIAQYRSGKSFQDVPIYVCIHPRIMRWSDIPKYYKQWR